MFSNYYSMNHYIQNYVFFFNSFKRNLVSNDIAENQEKHEKVFRFLMFDVILPWLRWHKKERKFVDQIITYTS